MRGKPPTLNPTDPLPIVERCALVVSCVSCSPTQPIRKALTGIGLACAAGRAQALRHVCSAVL